METTLGGGPIQPRLGLVRQRAKDRKLSRARQVTGAAGGAAGAGPSGPVPPRVASVARDEKQLPSPFAQPGAVRRSRTRPSRHPSAAAKRLGFPSESALAGSESAHAQAQAEAQGQQRPVPTALVARRTKGGALKRRVPPPLGAQLTQPARASASSSSSAPLASLDSLRSSLCEIGLTLRLSIEDDAALAQAEEHVQGSLAFLGSLAAHAEQRGALQGAMFQELLRSCGPSMGHLGRTPTMKVHKAADGGDGGGAGGSGGGGGGVVSRVCGDPLTTIRMAMDAQKLINLVRVKLEDDNDLNLARRCLGDARTCFAQLKGHAEQRSMSVYELYRQLS